MPLPKTKRGDYARRRNRTKMVLKLMDKYGIGKFAEGCRILKLLDQGCSLTEGGMPFIRRWNGGMVINPTDIGQKGYNPRSPDHRASTRKG